jgi:hypothetical protein
MTIPKIEFRYSWVYDDRWREFYDNRDYPDGKDTKNNILRIEKEWQKNGDLVLRELAKVSGLKWKEKTITCYVAGRVVAFSDPLTIAFIRNAPVDRTIDILTHELIHQLFIQNDYGKRAYKAWEYIYRKYKKEEFNTIIHIPVHALYYHIFMKFFGEKRLQREIDSVKDYPDYKRAWDIVLETGAENIIGEFRKRIY